MLRFLKNIFAKPAQGRLAQALNRLDRSAEGFRLAAEKSGPPHAQLFWQLAGATSDLRNRIEADPAQITPLRKLIAYFIPKMSELCLRWARLAALNPLETADPAALAEFQGYLSLIQSAGQACLSRQYGDLHASMKTMEHQMQRYAF